MANRTKRLKTALIVVAVLAVTAAIGTFYKYRHFRARLPIKNADTASTAIMALSQVRQTATKDGAVQWELEADTAELDAESGKMVIQSPVVHFILEDGSKVRLTARKGVLYTRNNDMSVEGNVLIHSDRYTFETGSLAYRHSSRILKADVPVHITGQAIDLQAAGMTYHLDENLAEFKGQVEGTLYEDPAI